MPTSSPSNPDSASGFFHFRVAGVGFRILGSPATLQAARMLYGLVEEREAPSPAWEIVWEGTECRWGPLDVPASGGRRIARVAHEEAIPALTALLVGRALRETPPPKRIFHANALFDPATGTFLVLAGPSGAGKSTLTAALMEMQPGLRLAAEDWLILETPGAEGGDAPPMRVLPFPRAATLRHPPAIHPAATDPSRAVARAAASSPTRPADSGDTLPWIPLDGRDKRKTLWHPDPVRCLDCPHPLGEAVFFFLEREPEREGREEEREERGEERREKEGAGEPEREERDTEVGDPAATSRARADSGRFRVWVSRADGEVAERLRRAGLSLAGVFEEGLCARLEFDRPLAPEERRTASACLDALGSVVLRADRGGAETARAKRNPTGTIDGMDTMDGTDPMDRMDGMDGMDPMDRMDGMDGMDPMDRMDAGTLGNAEEPGEPEYTREPKHPTGAPPGNARLRTRVVAASPSPSPSPNPPPSPSPSSSPNPPPSPSPSSPPPFPARPTGAPPGNARLRTRVVAASPSPSPSPSSSPNPPPSPSPSSSPSPNPPPTPPPSPSPSPSSSSPFPARPTCAPLSVSEAALRLLAEEVRFRLAPDPDSAEDGSGGRRWLSLARAMVDTRCFAVRPGGTPEETARMLLSRFAASP